MKPMISLSLALLLAAISIAQCFAEPRILLVGDSWTALMWEQRSLQTALANEGLSEFEVKGELTANGGQTARILVGSDHEWKTVVEELARYPSIDIIHLIIGGNDIFLELALSFNFNNLQSLIPPIMRNIETLTTRLLDIRPTIRVLLIDYDYLQTQLLPFISIQNQNQLFIDIASEKLALSKRIDRLEYLGNLGLMQSTFGIPGVYAPGELPAPGIPPDHSPLAGGDPDRASPFDTYDDAIHLSEAGYAVLAERCVDAVYRDWLLNPLPQTQVGDWAIY